MARRTAQQLSVDELRAQISQRLRSNAAFSKTVYQDQPLIMTGSQLKSFVPDAIREARQLAKQGYARNLSVVDVFYEQARLLAGYEDDFEFTGTFSHYYPSYEDMSNEQLRGYFAWRTKVRHGNVEQGSLSFAYVYLYELINLIGVSSAQDAYDTLLAFGNAYRRFDTRFGQLFDTWLDDFVIYYGLDASLLRTRSFAKRDAACATRLRADGLEAFMDFWEQLPLFASQRDLPPDVRERLRAGRMANDAEALARTFEQAGQHVMPSRAETLETLAVLRAGGTPLLYLAGERDEKYRALAAQAAEAGATVCIIPGAGHNAHLEAPATFAKEVASFLRK